MTREDFLKTSWVAYPAAGEGWLDVRDFLKLSKSSHESSVVAGRLNRQSTHWTLESGGASVNFEFASMPTLNWLRPLDTGAVANPALLTNGDLVALRFDHAIGKNGYLIAVELLLLAPSSGRRDPTTFVVETSRQWADMLEHIRQFFKVLDFIEARTPTLVPSPGTEPYLDPFSTEWLIGSRSKTFYLPTSPEFHLKQMLVAGWTKIFEFKDCFRNGEIGGHHQPEFLMLEWYRAYANLNQIGDDVDRLLQALALRFNRTVPPLRRVKVSDLFHAAYDGFLLTPQTNRLELASLAQAHGISSSSDDSFDDVFFRLFLERIEPTLGSEGPVLVSHYPPSQAALSRIGDHGFAERFEIYWKGLELANAFHELNDPAANEQRFKDDAERKSELGKSPVPRDENLVRALGMGLPPSGGIALGVDRLFMALFGIKEIADTRAFAMRLE
jgi:lysyl-tRNA synthetase class 2